MFGEPIIVELIDPEVVDVNADSDDASAVNEYKCFCKVGGLYSRDQSRSKSRMSIVWRLTFLKCRDFLDG